MADRDPSPGAPEGGPGSDRLQALLSRAVEAQLAEQREVSAALTELRTLLTGLDEQLRHATSASRSDELAARVADLLLERLSAVLVEQVTERVTASVQEGLLERVREAGEEAERRLAAHVDDAVLVLAEALLRPRRGGRASGAGREGAAEVGRVLSVEQAAVVDGSPEPEGQSESEPTAHR